MKRIYLIAQDEIVISPPNLGGMPETETRVCYNLKAFTDEVEAQKVADRHNKLMEETDEAESYYVLPVELKSHASNYDL